MTYIRALQISETQAIWPNGVIENIVSAAPTGTWDTFTPTEQDAWELVLAEAGISDIH